MILGGVACNSWAWASPIDHAAWYRDMLYHGAMGYSTVIKKESRPACWSVSLKVALSREETNELFLSGDSMLSWPPEGLIHASDAEVVPERSGMFVSEVAAQDSGLVIRYAEESQADKAVALLHAQLEQIGIKEEA